MKTLSSKQVKNLEGQTISFGKAYIKSCQLHNVNVLPHLISADPCHLDLDVTKFASDQDWTPVIASLKKNRDLQKIVINANARARMDGKNNLKLLPDLMASVRDVLMFNIKLTSLEITNIALKDGILQILAKGLLNNTSLNYLSLSKSSIGDSGLATLSPGLRTLNNLQVLNLTSCCLTEKGASTISSFLKVSCLFT
jgi:Ran GTPase-activating protein (RanGAP) involved in mRNA processing and transport